MTAPGGTQGRRRLLQAGLSAAVGSATGLWSVHTGAAARGVRLVVPAPAGSSLDVVARSVVEPLRELWGLAPWVDNKPGAGGVVGMDVVAKALPDGNTLGLGFNGPMALAPLLMQRMPYEPQRHLVALALATLQPNLLAVPVALPTAHLGEFLGWARRQARGVAYASVGLGSTSHLLMERWRRTVGFDAVHVPYNGSPPAAQALASGEVQALFALEPALAPLVQAGRVRLLASSGARRSRNHPELPTLAEAGAEGLEAHAWNGWFAPAGLPPTQQTQIEADLLAALRDPRSLRLLERAGLQPEAAPASTLAWHVSQERQLWEATVQRLGLRHTG